MTTLFWCKNSYWCNFQCSCHLFLLNVKMCFVWEDLFFVHWCWSYPHFEVKMINILIHWTSNWITKCFSEQIIKGWIESCVVHLEIDFIFVFLYFKQTLMRNQHLLVLISLLIAVEGASIIFDTWFLTFCSFFRI